jgi:hypothetical protein
MQEQVVVVPRPGERAPTEVRERELARRLGLAVQAR